MIDNISKAELRRESKVKKSSLKEKVMVTVRLELTTLALLARCSAD